MKQKTGPKNIYNIENYLGKKFGEWTVIGFSHRDKSRTQNWRMRCSCGEDEVVLLSNLIRGTSTCCRICSANNSRGNKNAQWQGGEFLSASYFQRLKVRARKANIDFSIDISDLEKIFLRQKGRCVYTDLELKFSPVQSGINHKRVFDQTASVDRIDSTKGYHKNNIQFVHKTVNVIKWDLDENEFLDLVQKIYCYRQLGGKRPKDD